MLKKANIQWGAGALVKQMRKSNIDFSCSVQRGYVWDAGRKSLLIHSMIAGFPIPAFFFSKDDEGKYTALDGKQRSSAIYGFITGEYSLSDIPVVFDDDGNEYDVSGMNFEQLPEFAQQAIKDYSLTIYYFEGITDDEVSELFYRLNNGKPLTAIELTRVKARSLEAYQSIANHPAIQSAVSDKGKEKYIDEQIAMHIWMMCYNEKPSFVTKDSRPIIEGAEVKTSEMNLIMECLNLVYELYEEYDPETKEDKAMLRRLKARTHLVSLAYMAKLCIEQNREKAFITIAKEFFSPKSGTSTNPAYNKAAGVGSGKPESVRARMNAVKEAVGYQDELMSA